MDLMRDNIIDGTALFIDNIPGGVLVECSVCRIDNESKEPWGQPLYCRYCKTELGYPDGASW